MKAPEDLALAAELRALSPAPRPEFAAELDARAAAGFPRRRGGGDNAAATPAGGPLDRLVDWLRALSPRQITASAGAVALATLAVATVVVVGSEGRSSNQGHRLDIATATEHRDGRSATDQGMKRLAEGRFLRSGKTNFNGSHTPTQRAAGAGEASAASSQAALPKDSAASLKEFSREVPSASGPYASQSERRSVERSAEMVLGTDPADVRRAAGKVFEAVHAYDGIVLQSSIEDGGEGEAGASFELLIPSGKLGDALASFSSIAEVRSRHEATADVTAKTVSLGERLQDSQATTEGLLAQLATADSDGERAAAETELHSERLHAATLRARLADVQRRANLSHVSLKIETAEAGAAPADQDGSWGIGDALDDAGHILEVAAGIALIGLAILAPIALLCLLAWLGHRTWVRRRRESALG